MSGNLEIVPGNDKYQFILVMIKLITYRDLDGNLLWNNLGVRGLGSGMPMLEFISHYREVDGNKAP